MYKNLKIQNIMMHLRILETLNELKNKKQTLSQELAGLSKSTDTFLSISAIS